MKIPFFKKKEPIVDFSDGPEDDKKDKEPRIGYTFKKFPRSADDVPPGEILRLYYPKSGDKTVLIVSTERGSRGHFKSTRGNTLICCFELSEDSIVFDVILKVFHKNQGRSRYTYAPSFLKKIFGLSYFKTLNKIQIQDIQILIKEKEIKK